MNNCAEYISRLQLYIDGELTPEESEPLLSHVGQCADCRRILEELERESAIVRRSRPAVHAPDHLRSAILQRMQQSNPGVARPALVARPPRKILSWPLSAAAALLLFVGGALALYKQRQPDSELMLRTAMSTHQLIEQHSLALDVNSDSPQMVSSWFVNKVAFPFHMADSGLASHDRDRYKLVGGRLMMVEKERVALLAFQLSGETITLLVTPEKLIKPSGDTVTDSDGVRLYSQNRDAFHLVMWRNRGLGYVLTAHNPARDFHQCTSCHIGSSESKHTARGYSREQMDLAIVASHSILPNYAAYISAH